MASSWTEFVWGYKSRLSALARSCFLRRRHWQEKCIETRQALARSEELLALSERRCQQLEQQLQAADQQIARWQLQFTTQTVLLPVGTPPPGQQYGANLMALSVNLGRKLGVRPAHRALKIFSCGWGVTSGSPRTRPFAAGCSGSVWGG